MLTLFFVFLRLGLTSFGGPAAHLGYFRKAFVDQRGWFNDEDYARLVALCQFLPGPASSQVAFAIGMERRGWLGGLSAWGAFTFPSFCIMTAAAYGVAQVQGPLAAAIMHGLKLAAVAVVADALVKMARTLTPDRSRAAIAVAALVLVTGLGGGLAQVAAVAGGLGCGAGLLRPTIGQSMSNGVSRPGPSGLVALTSLVVLLTLSLVPGVSASPLMAEVSAFFRAGALVFGGGHVVLPLLDKAVVAPGWVSRDAFLSGYGIAQALPGPLFSFAAYLGALSKVGPGGVGGALVAMGAISAPGLLAVGGALPFWRMLASQRWAQGAVAGANAAVVGLLASAFYNPIWVGSVRSAGDFALAGAAWVALSIWRAPPLMVIAALAAVEAAGIANR